MVDGLAAYTHRHLSRLDRLVRSTYLLDYTLSSMKVGKFGWLMAVGWLGNMIDGLGWLGWLIGWSDTVVARA